MTETGGRNRHDTSGANRIERRQSERRRYLRFPFTAAVDAVEPQSKAKVSGRTTDISQEGCYVDTISPFPVGTIVKICLTKESVTFEANAKVVLSQAGMGMGVALISAVPQQHRIFQKWLSQLAGKSLHEVEPTEKIENDAVVANSIKNPDFVLRELLIVLMKKGVLSEVDGKAMLQRLYR